MLTFITIIHVLVCIFMMFVILLQPGKDAGMGAALGGGAATSAFGGRGAVTFLSKLTAVCACLFFITSLSLSFVGMRSSVAAGLTVPSKKAPGRGVADGGTAPSGGSGAATPSEPQDAPVSEEAQSNDAAADKPAASSESKKSSPEAPAPAQKRAPASKKK